MKKLVKERLYAMDYTSAQKSSADGAEQKLNEMLSRLDKEFDTFVEDVDIALRDYANWKGVPLPSECSYDTVGNLKKWGENGRTCAEKCKVEIYQASNFKGEPVEFVEGVYMGLDTTQIPKYVNLNAPLPTSAMAKFPNFEPEPKSIRMGKECDGIVMKGLDKNKQEVMEEWFNPMESADSGSESKIVTLQLIQVLTTDAPRPEGWFGFVYVKGSAQGKKPKNPKTAGDVEDCGGQPMCIMCGGYNPGFPVSLTGEFSAPGCSSIVTACCANPAAVVDDFRLFRFEGRQIKSKLGGCLYVDVEDGVTLRVSGNRCKKKSAYYNSWHLDEGRVVAPAVPGNDKTMCIGVREGSCIPGAAVELKACDEATPDLAWKPTIVENKGGCAEKEPEEEEEDAVCTLYWYKGTGYNGLVAKYTNGKYYTRKRWWRAFFENIGWLKAFVQTNSTTAENASGVMARDGLSSDKSYKKTLLQQRLRGGAEEAAYASEADGTLTKKGGSSGPIRHQSDMGSFIFQGPKGCKVTMFSEEKFKGDRCNIDTDTYDVAYGGVKDDKVTCTDTPVCCPIEKVASLQISYTKMG
jgi:hypothetical protein